MWLYQNKAAIFDESKQTISCGYYRPAGALIAKVNIASVNDIINLKKKY